jgi:hypothetical protein
MTSNFILQLNTYGYSSYVTSFLTRGWVCCLQLLMASPAQSFSGPSPAGLMATFYCLRFKTPPAWRARSLYLYLPGRGWPGYTHRHWVPFSSPPTTHWAMVEEFEPPPHGYNCHYNPTDGPSRKCHFQQYLYCCMRIRYRGNAFTEPLPRTASGIFAYLAVVALHTTISTT